MNTHRGTPRPVMPKPGDVMKIHESNHRFGLGELVLRVTAIREVQHLESGAWLTVLGIQLGWNGVDVGEREVLVRLSSLVPHRGRS